MAYKTELQENNSELQSNNADLQSILDIINALPTPKSISATDDGNGNVTLSLSGYTATYNNGNITIE